MVLGAGIPKMQQLALAISGCMVLPLTGCSSENSCGARAPVSASTMIGRRY
jgi:hypothetical protein